MKLIYKGNFENNDQLPKGILPKNAVKFVEPKSPDELNKAVSIVAIPIFLIVFLLIVISLFLNKGKSFDVNIYGILLSLLTIFPHEYLHAICFGKDSEVELFIAPKKLMLFVVSVQPVTKMRFIFLSLLPNLIFGWIPFIMWLILPYSKMYSNILISFAVTCILFGVGDYLNVYNAIRQMPKGSMQQLSGFNSHWFMP